MTEENKIFRLPVRVLIDGLLILNSSVFVALAANFLTERAALSLAMGCNMFLVGLFFLILRPMLRVEIREGALIGPALFLKRDSILLRKIDVRRSLEFHRRADFLGYRDLWSIDGRRVRLYRRFLGKTNQYYIVKMIKNHPFRDSVEASKGSSAKL